MKNGYKTTSDIDTPKVDNTVKFSKSELDDLTESAFTYGMLCGGVSTMLFLILAKIITAILN